MEAAITKHLRAIRDKEVQFNDALDYVGTGTRDTWRKRLDGGDLSVLFAHHERLGAVSAAIVRACEGPWDNGSNKSNANTNTDAGGMGKALLDSLAALEAAAGAFREACAVACDAAPIRLRHFRRLCAAKSALRKLVEQQATERNRVSFDEYAALPGERAVELAGQVTAMVSSMARAARKGKVADVELGKAQYACARRCKRILTSLIEEDINGGRVRTEEDVARLEEAETLLPEVELERPFRKFLGVEVLSKISESAVQERSLFIFNDVLIYAKRTGGKEHAMRGSIDPGRSWVRDLPDCAKAQNLFQIVAPEKTYTFFSKDPETKARTVRAVSQCIASLEAAYPALLEDKADVNAPEPSGLGKLRTIHPRDFDPEYGKTVPFPGGAGGKKGTATGKKKSSGGNSADGGKVKRKVKRRKETPGGSADATSAAQVPSGSREGKRKSRKGKASGDDGGSDDDDNSDSDDDDNDDDDENDDDDDDDDDNGGFTLPPPPPPPPPPVVSKKGAKSSHEIDLPLPPPPPPPTQGQ